MTGEIIVAGLVTGTHIIEDIGVAVPHQVAVLIPADQAIRSRDLQRGLQQGKLFKLDGGSGIRQERSSPEVTAQHDASMARLEAENKQLRFDLEAERIRSGGLATLLGGLEAQLAGMRQAIGALGALPRVVQVVQGQSAQGAHAALPDVVGGDAPTFIPDRIRPTEDFETQIRTETATTDKSNVSNASSKLREMKTRSG